MRDPAHFRYLLIVCLLTATGAVLAGCEGGEGETDYADTLATQHADDTTEATAIVMEPTIPVQTETVQFGLQAGESFTGYFARPTNPDSVAEQFGTPSRENLPGLIVIHEWWGLNENIETMTRRLAGEGFQALAVDLYGGAVAESPERARELVQQAMGRRDSSMAALEAAYQYLTSERQAGEVGIIGWCFGGTMALQGAAELSDQLDAAVIYYGDVTQVEDQELQNIDMPLIGFFGADDQSIPVEEVRSFEGTVEGDIHIYENAGHAFANPSGDNFVAEAARDAWDKTVSFLRDQLYGGGS